MFGKRSLLPLFTFSVVLPAVAAEKSFDVSGFSALLVKGSTDVTLIQGDAEGVILKGDEDTLRKMRVFVENDVLHIQPKKRPGFSSWFSDSDNVQAQVSFKSLERIRAAGSSDLQADGLRDDRLEVYLDGGGSVDFVGLELDKIAVEINGSGDIELAGEAEQHDIQINGAGSYSALQLDSDRVWVVINGSGDVEVSAKDELKIRINGSGDIAYAGTPRVSERINCSGDVRQLSVE